MLDFARYVCYNKANANIDVENRQEECFEKGCAMLSQRRRFWAEIDLDAAKDNFIAIKDCLRHDSKLFCVVKAKAYGHGAVQLARLYEELGADWLAVSNIEEGLQLRQNRIRLPILILGYTPAVCAGLLATNGISQTVFSYEYAEELDACASEAGVKLNIHIKLDSGMGRLGFSCRHGMEDTGKLDEALEACRLSNLIPEGVFTHFALADGGESGEAYTKEQLSAFLAAVDYMKERGVTFALRHTANSAAILDFPEAQLDMVRAGIVLYGLAPSRQLRRLPRLMPVMSLRAVVSFVKEIREGDTVSYGCQFTAPRAMRIATAAVGYADGYRRASSENGTSVLLRGKRVPIVGRVCMDRLMLDVSSLPDVRRDDVVTVLGQDGEETVSAEELAERNGTISYEILCDVGERVPRFYLKNKKIVAVKDNIIAFEPLSQNGEEI